MIKSLKKYSVRNKYTKHVFGQYRLFTVAEGTRNYLNSLLIMDGEESQWEIINV